MVKKMHFRLFNIPVTIQPGFWLFLLFFTRIYRDPSIESLTWGGILILSLLIHECGHALTARYYGIQPNITLEAFGGSTHFDSYTLTPKQQFLITFNGPLFESSLIILSYALLKSGVFEHHTYLQYLCHVTMRLNILWCLLNLIPVIPLDGGYLLRYLLEKKFGVKGYKTGIIVGIICVVLIAPYLYLQGFFFFGTLLLIYGFQNFLALQQTPISSQENLDFISFTKAQEAINTHEIKKAKNILKKLLKAKDISIKYSAMKSLAKIYFQENESQKSYDLLLAMDPQYLKEGKCLLCRLAFEKQNYELVSRYSRDIYALEPSYDIALLNAKAFAHLNEVDLSLGWLETASKFGADYKQKIREILDHSTFDLVKKHEAFKNFEATIQ